MTDSEKFKIFENFCNYVDSLPNEDVYTIIKEWLDKNLGECWVK